MLHRLLGCRLLFFNGKIWLIFHRFDVDQPRSQNNRLLCLGFDNLRQLGLVPFLLVALQLGTPKQIVASLFVKPEVKLVVFSARGDRLLRSLEEILAAFELGTFVLFIRSEQVFLFGA